MLFNQGERIKRELSARSFRRQEKNLVQFLCGAGLQQGKQGPNGLADAGGRLGNEATPDSCVPVNSLSQLPLPLTKGRIGKAQYLQCLVSPQAVCEFLLSPIEKASACAFEVLVE